MAANGLAQYVQHSACFLPTLYKMRPICQNEILYSQQFLYHAFHKLNLLSLLVVQLLVCSDYVQTIVTDVAAQQVIHYVKCKHHSMITALGHETSSALYKHDTYTERLNRTSRSDTKRQALSF